MKPYAMVLPSTALFGSSFGSLFLKTIGSSNASLLLILVFAFVITYSIGYLFMRRPQLSCDSETASAAGDQRTKAKETNKTSSAGGATGGGGEKDETTPLLDDSADEEDDDEGLEGSEDEEAEDDAEEEQAAPSQSTANEGER
ncbi:uncharacterized protein LOC144127573 [Amblyomma americanum]